MPRVLVTRPIPGNALTRLGERCAVDLGQADHNMPRSELLRRVAGIDGLLCMLADRIDAELMDAAGPSLKAVSNYAVGYNNIDVAEATRRGIIVTNTPGVLTEATADMAWALLFAAARRVAEGDRLTRSGGFTGWTPTMLLGAEIRRRTLGLIGLGRIGEAMIAPAHGFGMKVIYYDPRRRSAEDEALLGIAFAPLSDLLARADFVSVHVPLTGETRHLLDEGALRRMKQTAILVNTSRGPVVDEKALVKALQEGWIAGAGLDVYEEEPKLAPGLAECERAVLAPHLGSATLETRSRMAELAVDNLLAALEGRRPEGTLTPR
jgi:glyoxylate reductase